MFHVLFNPMINVNCHPVHSGCVSLAVFFSDLWWTWLWVWSWSCMCLCSCVIVVVAVVVINSKRLTRE